MSGTVRKAISFGLFAALSLGLTFVIGAQIAKVQLGVSRYRLSATFDDATNLHAGDPVRLAGVPVGQVQGVKVLDGRAQVRFEVDRDVALSRDSEVAVRWLNIIGQRELYLYPGTGDGRLADGDTVERTRSVVDLGALLNELGPLTRSLDPAQINRLVEALVTALDGNRTAVDDVIGGLAQVVHQLADRKGTIEQLVHDYATIGAQVGRRDLEIQRVVDNLAELTKAFADSDPVLAAALTDLPRLVTNLQHVLGDDAAGLGSTVDSLALVTRAIHDHLADVETVTQALPKGMAIVDRSTSYGQFALVNAICLSPTPPPCPTPVILAADTSGAGRVSSADDLGRLVLGSPS